MMEMTRWDELASKDVPHELIYADELYKHVIGFVDEVIPDLPENREYISTLFKVMMNDILEEFPVKKANKCRDCEYLEVTRMYKGKDGKLKGSGECMQRPKKRGLHKKSYTAFSNTACKNFKQCSIPISLEVEHNEESV